MSGLALVATLASLTACWEQPAGPAAGILEVHLSSPHSDDGALLFNVTGGPVDSVAAAGYAVYSSRSGVNQIEVIVAGDLASGTIARLYIPDSRLGSQYSATVTQAAARGSYELHDPTGYAVTVSE